MARQAKRKYASESYGDSKELLEQQAGAEMFKEEESGAISAIQKEVAATGGMPNVANLQPINRPTEIPFESVEQNNLNQFGSSLQMDKNFILRQMYAVLPSSDILALMDDGVT
tara:strand:+ start:22299 stop:22637 length:339 start_codon:yes stop_codon:yes gene_type:complete